MFILAMAFYQCNFIFSSSAIWGQAFAKYC